jgi:N4-gp56 family major capsid protein
MYGNNATSKADLDSADKMSVNLIERAVARAEVMGGGTQEVPQIQPVMIDGEEHYCIVMHPFQAYDLRSSTGTSDWLEIQKAAAGAEGRNSPIFKGSLGMHNNVLLHKHKNVVRFSDYGAGANVAAARALFLGEQAAVCAFGSPGNNLRFDWHEETRDNGNQLVISTSSIFGVKKTTYNGKDYGVIALDTAAADPN